MVDRRYPANTPRERPGFQGPSAKEYAFLTPAAGAALRDVGRVVSNEALAARTAGSVLRTVAPWVARAGARAIPYVGWGLAAYEVYELLHPSSPGKEGSEGGWLPNPGAAGGWTEKGSCGAEAEIKCISAVNTGHLSTGYICAQLQCPSTEVTELPSRMNSFALVGEQTYRPDKRRIVKKLYWREPMNPGSTPGTEPLPVKYFPPGAPRKPQYVYYPYPIPMVADPMLQPIGLPMGTPQPIPYYDIPKRQPNPNRSPVEQTQTGNALPPEVEEPSFPGEQPTTVIDPGAESGGVTKEPPSHGYKPPAKGTKERKYKVSLRGVAGAGVAGVINLATEAADFVDALYDALPDEKKVHFWYKKPGWRHSHYVEKYSLTPQQKAVQLYNVLDTLDGAWLERALHNVVVNEIKDRAIGGLSHGASGLNQAVGRNIGIQVGPAL